MADSTERKFDWVKTVLFLDRRIIYTIVALAVGWPILSPVGMPIVTTPEVQGIYEVIDSLPEGSHVMISADFDPASKPELLPMLDAALAHCFVKNLKPTVMTLWPAGPRLMQQAVERQAERFKKTSGSDYVYLGYRPGNASVIIGVSGAVTTTYGSDYYNKPTAPMPIFQEVHSLSDYDFILDIAAGATIEPWVIYGSTPSKVPMGASCTAVSAAQHYALLQAKQITGLAGGMKGSAEYEKLLQDNYSSAGFGDFTGDATKGMDAQSFVHLFIVLSIVLANVAFFVSRRSEPGARRAS